MNAFHWRGPLQSRIGEVGQLVRIGRPPGSNHFTEHEAKQRQRAASLKWWNEVGKERRANALRELQSTAD
jgi:hypothetical protein